MTPIAKWAGGKTRLLPELLSRAPAFRGRYYEPLAGGAALFFALAPERAVLADANADLIAMYTAVRDAPEAVIALLRELEAQHSERNYYATRARWNDGDRNAAAFLYLNRTCFNGLWRVNRAGAFNVPIGDYADPAICRPEAIRAASAALQRAELRCGDYRESTADAAAGDFVYFDPPYDGPGFTGYTADAFGPAAQAELAEHARLLAARGCHVMLSNADTDRIRELYAGARIDRVSCPRAINSDASARGAVDEVIITASPGARNPMTRPAKRQEQLDIPGTAVPKDPVLTEAMDNWLDALDAKKASAEDAKLCHAVLLARMTEKGAQAYGYLDRATGKRRIVKIKADAKLVTADAPRAERADREKDMAGSGSAASRDADLTRAARAAVRATATPETRVTAGWADGPKTEIMPDLSARPAEDPFAATRAAMAEDLLDDETPAQRAARESAEARAARRNGGAA